MIRAVALLIVLSVAAAGVTLGAARGQVRMAGQVILCSGSAHSVQIVDDFGQPVRRPGICPDMALILLASGAVMPPALPARAPGRAVVHVIRSDVPAGTGAVRAQARGPPVRPGIAT